MNNNEELIYHFYTCFKNKDIEGMQNCYADHAVFSDTVFQNLDARQVRSMWKMLIGSAKDMHIEYNQVKADENSGSAQWTATYTFSATGKKVVNHIQASFQFENGKIIKHQDEFNFHQWAKQALGFTGLLLGWTPFLKNKIRKKASGNLKSYMDIHQASN